MLKAVVRTVIAAIFLFVAGAGAAAAHPGIGIVLDRQGNVYYTDLAHVWRVAPDGSRTIVVRDVHTHQLAIDDTDTLYGEDNRYLGGDRYRHRIWRRTPDGRVSDILPWQDGFWAQYGFVRDAAGTQYWAQCPERVCEIRRRTPGGAVTTVPQATPFDHQVQFLAPIPGGGLYVLDGDTLKVLAPDGRVSTRAAALGGGPMGTWVEPDGTVYIAVYGRRAVVRVDPDGNVVPVLRTAADWGPSGIARAPNGDFWVLEYSTSNAARVRRVGAADSLPRDKE